MTAKFQTTNRERTKKLFSFFFKTNFVRGTNTKLYIFFKTNFVNKFFEQEEKRGKNKRREVQKIIQGTERKKTGKIFCILGKNREAVPK